MKLQAVGYHLRGSFTHLARHPLYSMAGILTLAVSLILVGFVGLLIWKANNLVERISGGLTLTVYVENQVSVGAVQELSALIQEKWPEVESVSFHTSEEDRRRNLALLPKELLEELDPALIPAQPYLEIRLAMGRIHEQRMNAMVAWFRSLNDVQGVDEVLFGAEKIAVAYSLAKGARNLGLFLSVVILVAALFFVLTTTRLIVEGRKEEIEVLLLVGATPLFIRIPHYIEGVIQGVLAGFAAFAGVWVLQRGLLGGLSSQALLNVPLDLLPPGMMLWFGLGGATLGLLGSVLGIARYLKMTQ
jgi:cell division transport system permease protein